MYPMHMQTIETFTITFNLLSQFAPEEERLLEGKMLAPLQKC